MRKLCLAILLWAVLCGAARAEFAVSAKGAVLIEAGTGCVLFGQNENEMLPMASTTKIMTCLVALENAALDDVVTVGKNAVGITGTSIFLGEGEQLTLEQLLYGLMLRSGNDAAVAIAEHVSGSEDKFVETMNRKAADLGVDAHYANPHGLDAKGHKASALAQALIMREGLKNKDFARITSTKEKVIPWPGNEYSRVLTNKNRLLTSYEGASGGKTGFTSKAGRCLVFSAEREGMTLIGCVLNCSSWFDTATAMLDYGFENYDLVTPIRAGEIVASIRLAGGRARSADVTVVSDVAVPVPLEAEYHVDFELPDEVIAPVRQGDLAGYAVVISNDSEVYRAPLVYRDDIAQNSIETALNRVMDSWVINSR